MLLNESIKAFVQTTPSLFYLATFAAFVSLFAVIINRHEHPTNINLLALFTVLESYTIGTAGTDASATSCIVFTCYSVFLRCRGCFAGRFRHGFHCRVAYGIHVPGIIDRIDAYLICIVHHLPTHCTNRPSTILPSSAPASCQRCGCSSSHPSSLCGHATLPVGLSIDSII